MITYAKIALILFDLLQSWIKGMERRGLIEQGRSQLVRENLEVQREEFNVAVAARQAVRNNIARDPDSGMRDDPFQRPD